MLAAWLRPILWRERDWSETLTRVLAALTATVSERRTRAVDLGRACEHVVPDRRRAIAAYAAGGPGAELGRARALAIELGWWPALARLALIERADGGDPALAQVEFEAWLDAGEPGLAAAVALDAVAAAPGDPWLRALDRCVRGGGDPSTTAQRVGQAASASGDAAGWLTAARLARLAGDVEGGRRYLAEAVTAAPREVRASALLLAALDDDAAIHRLVRARLHGLAPLAWIDTARALGGHLAAQARTRGLGLRLVRAALTLAYEHGVGGPPGHLAMWSILTAHAAAAGERTALLPLAATALEQSNLPADDRLWLAALGAEIAWQDASNLTVARAWAAVAAEVAPRHPVVVALAEASFPPRSVATALSAHAPHGAASMPEVEVDIDLGDLVEPAPHEVVAISAAAVQAAGQAVDATAAAPAPRPIISGALQAALGRLGGRLPELPARALRPDAKPRAARIAVPLDATIALADGPPLTVVCRDISATGLFVLTATSLPVGELVDLTVQTPTDEAWVERSHQARARVVRRESRGYGLELVAPPADLLIEIDRLAR